MGLGSSEEKKGKKAESAEIVTSFHVTLQLLSSAIVLDPSYQGRTRAQSASSRLNRKYLLLLGVVRINFYPTCQLIGKG